MSLRLETSWFSAEDAEASNNCGGNNDPGSGSAPQSPASGLAGGVENDHDGRKAWEETFGEQRGPEQWDEERILDFIQVNFVALSSFLRGDILR